MVKFITYENQIFSIDSLSSAKEEGNRLEVTYKGGFLRIDGLTLDGFINVLNEANEKNLFVVNLNKK